MPTTYEQCGEDVEALVQRVIKKYHHDLKEAGVTIGLLYAHNSEGVAVKLHGYPCAAVVKKNSLKDRAEGKADATIVIDQSGWEEMDEKERIALLDHELYHLEVKRDKFNHYDLDDLGRPKLNMKLHDAQIGVFKTIIERHGMHAIDAQVSEKFIGEYSQLLLWTQPNADAVKAAPADPDLLDAAAKLAPSPGSGIESVTLSTGTQSVTLTTEHAKKLKKMAKELRS